MPTIAYRLYQKLKPLEEMQIEGKNRRIIWSQMSAKYFSGNSNRLFSDIFGGCDEIKAQLNAAPIDDETRGYYNSQLDDILAELDIRHIEKAWTLNPRNIKCLIAIDSLLKHTGWEEPAIDLSLDELRTELLNLRTDINQSTIHPVLKRFLLEALSGLMSSIEHFDIYGEAGLKRAYAASLGNLHAIQDIPDIGNLEETRPIFERFSKMLKGLNAAIKFGNDASGLIKKIQDIGGSLPPPS